MDNEVKIMVDGIKHKSFFKKQIGFIRYRVDDETSFAVRFGRKSPGYLQLIWRRLPYWGITCQIQFYESCIPTGNAETRIFIIMGKRFLELGFTWNKNAKYEIG